jgi:Cu+-exporting ATPase
MQVDPTTSKHRIEYKNQITSFCSAHCETKFADNPDAYLHGSEKKCAAADSTQGLAHTCPMHSEIRQDAPGACPVCGMSLEQVMPAAQAPNDELTDMTRRFFIGVAFTLAVIALEMRSGSQSAWAQCILSAPVVFWAGLPFFQRAWASLIKRSLNMFSLIALGIGSAYGYSISATATPSIFPSGFRTSDGSIPIYFEAACAITVLTLLGQILELRAREKTGEAVRALLDFSPKTARRLQKNGEEETITSAQVLVGDMLRIRPGDAVPVDGKVISGKSTIDESMVTGESVPATKTVGDKLIGGTVNGTGSLVMQAEQIGSHAVLARIIAMVAQAQHSRAPIQRTADVVASFFVPAVLGVAAIAFVAWAIWGPPPALAYALVSAVCVVIVACPCALGLATPTSIGVGIGKGARIGVFVKSAQALERMEKMNVLVVDKTGTLTQGKPSVTAILSAADMTEHDILAYAASLEKYSEHPLASTIVAAARDRGVVAQDANDFISLAGKGVSGEVNGVPVALGNAALMNDFGIECATLNETTDALAHNGATVFFLAVNKKFVAAIAVADPIKSTTSAALESLRASGIRIVMATGDNAATAQAVGRKLGIEDVEAGVLPEDKLRIVRALQEAGNIVAMAGDGINDAPGLAQADVGIAMGNASEAAIQSAGVILVKGDLLGIARARALSRATMRNVRQNLLFAFAYNILCIPVAAGVLYPAFGITLNPIVAAAAMSLSSVSVIINALRLRTEKLDSVVN